MGRELANALKYRFMDVEDYYFSKENKDYDYQNACSRDEVSKLLLKDLTEYEDFIFASVKGNYGDEVVSRFTHAVLVSVPKEERMKRVRDRSYQKFGNRMLQGGDLFEKENRFFEMVEKRPEQDVENWLQSVRLSVIRVDGTQTVGENIRIISARLATEAERRLYYNQDIHY